MTPDATREMVRQLVVSKLHSGARDQDVLDWLAKAHGLAGPDATDLLTNARAAKGDADRFKALLRFFISGIGLLFAGAFFGVQIWSGYDAARAGSVIILIVGLTSLGVFVRSARLLIGDANRTVD